MGISALELGLFGLLFGLRCWLCIDVNSAGLFRVI